MRTGGSVAKNPPANARDERDVGSIPGSGRSPGKGNGSPLQYFCLENPMDNRAWQAIVRGIQRVRHDWESKQQQNQWELVFIGKFWTTYSKWSEFRFGSESVGNEEQPPVLAWVKEYVTRVDALTCHVDPPSAKKDLLPQTAESSDFRQNSAPPWSWELLVLKGMSCPGQMFFLTRLASNSWSVCGATPKHGPSFTGFDQDHMLG